MTDATRGSAMFSGSALVRLVAGLTLFAFGYAVANRYQLTHGVLYRLAAGDEGSAIWAFLVLSIQAVALLAFLWIASLRLAILGACLAAASIVINLGYGQIVNAQVDVGVLVWLLTEARQAADAGAEFAEPLLLTLIQAAVAVALWYLARALLRQAVPVSNRPGVVAIALAGLLVPSLLGNAVRAWPFGAERNVYDLGLQIASAPSPPPRAPAKLRPDPMAGTPNHIVWLIDESVAYRPFQRLVAPQLQHLRHLNFGDATALANCSAPAHVALRSGVNVRATSPTTDLRRTPSIWQYAKRAGYATAIIGGQTTGAPQNLIFSPERALIDDLRSMISGMDTDRKIAAFLNAKLKEPSRSFTYVVLRGVHFQYADHFPTGSIPSGAPKPAQYEAALRWSKREFFQRLLDDVDRSDVAIVYTSDHGQNLAPRALPHCSPSGSPEELSVPLVLFLPERLADGYAGALGKRRSASQIFPATLMWMGYDPEEVQALYDNDLKLPSARTLWFGRAVVPHREGDRIEVYEGSKSGDR